MGDSGGAIGIFYDLLHQTLSMLLCFPADGQCSGEQSHCTNPLCPNDCHDRRLSCQCCDTCNGVHTILGRVESVCAESSLSARLRPAIAGQDLWRSVASVPLPLM